VIVAYRFTVLVVGSRLSWPSAIVDITVALLTPAGPVRQVSPVGLLRRSRKPAAFWYLSRQRLVVAVVSRYLDEPLMTACAMSTGSLSGGRSLFAPGLLEVSAIVSSRRLEHTAALSSEYCRLEEARHQDHDGSGDEAAQAAGERLVLVKGMADSWARAATAAIDEARGLFDSAGLKLTALDCEACAVATLSNHLGCHGDDALDPLAAVELHEGCIGAATELGRNLIVPVGLALARLGRPASHARG
jgi:hypothetical protein